MNNDSYNILIVDDLPKNIQVVAATLQTAGYNISFAQSGPRAIELCKVNDYDLVLLDIMMPEMDGIEVCSIIKSDEQFKDLPIIFLTAKNDIDSITKAFQAGGVDYVAKPFKGAELLARVKTHVTLKKQKEELSQLNATKDKFFSIIAHDLRSPFTGLLGFAELLIEESETAEPEDLKNYYQMMYQSANQGYKLLSDLLEWSRTQTSQIQFTPSENKVEDSIAENISLLENNSKEKSISIQAEIQDDLNVFADPNMLNTVVRNLLSNAIKFTKPDGNILISARKKDSFAEIRIKDDGIGMNDKTKSRLFKVDENVSRRGTNNEAGTGLGLIICKEFVEKNQGNIWVESEEGKGSSFYFTIPLS